MTLGFLKTLTSVEESGNHGLLNNGYYGCEEEAEGTSQQCLLKKRESVAPVVNQWLCFVLETVRQEWLQNVQKNTALPFPRKSQDSISAPWEEPSPTPSISPHTEKYAQRSRLQHCSWFSAISFTVFYHRVYVLSIWGTLLLTKWTWMIHTGPDFWINFKNFGNRWGGGGGRIHEVTDAPWPI